MKIAQRKTKHVQKSVVVHPTREIIEVDEMMVDLLEAMWDVGITTNFSCQGDGHLWVDDQHHEAARFQAYVQMRRDIWSLQFVQELLKEDFFAGDKVSFEIKFGMNPFTNEQLIGIYFPSSYISRITEAIYGPED